jgi:hypothetical protein
MSIRIALLAFTLATTAHAQSATAPHALLVELFTSEGCSSCPPADALLARLNGTKTTAGDLVVVLSEHVTYWNEGGWRDAFSTDAVTDRQRAYGERFHLDSVYTPQIVVNGEAQLNGTDQRSIVHALESSRPAAAIHIASAKTADHALDVTFSLTGTLPSGKADIYAVIAEDAATTTVLHGENAGRKLSHVAVATSIIRIATTGLTAERSIHLTLPPLPPGANSKRHLILFAQTPGLGPVLATDSVPL